MSSSKPKSAKVGIRELRQNLSVYVRRVREDGQAYEVTERGEPVARLMPLDGLATRIERMMADGQIAPAMRAASDLPQPLPPPVTGKPLSQILDGLRDEDSR